MAFQIAEIAHERGATLDVGRIHSTRQLGGGGPGTHRVRKYVEVAERQRFDKVKVRLEVTRGLTGKADDKISADCGVRPDAQHLVDSFAKMITLVAPAHLREQFIFAGLQRQMKMRTKLFTARQDPQNVVAQLFRIERADSNAFERASLGDHLEQGRQIASRIKILAVAAEMDAREHDFLEAARVEIVERRNHASRLDAAGSAA